MANEDSRRAIDVKKNEAFQFPVTSLNRPFDTQRKINVNILGIKAANWQRNALGTAVFILWRVAHSHADIGKVDLHFVCDRENTRRAKLSSSKT